MVAISAFSALGQHYVVPNTQWCAGSWNARPSTETRAAIENLRPGTLCDVQGLGLEIQLTYLHPLIRPDLKYYFLVVNCCFQRQYEEKFAHAHGCNAPRFNIFIALDCSSTNAT